MATIEKTNQEKLRIAIERIEGMPLTDKEKEDVIGTKKDVCEFAEQLDPSRISNRKQLEDALIEMLTANRLKMAMPLADIKEYTKN